MEQTQTKSPGPTGHIDYQRLLNSVDDPLVAVDLRCRITAFNRAAEEITGFRASELLDSPCTSVFADRNCEPICKAKAKRESGETHYDVELKRRLGPPLPVTVTTAPLYDEAGNLVGALETIHLVEGGRLDRRVREEAAHRLAILDSLAEAVVTVDSEWRISSVNAAATDLLGLEPATVLGKFCSRVLQTEHCANGCPLAQALEDGAPVRDRHLSVTRSSGDPVEVSLNAAVLRSEEGDALGGVLSFRPLPTIHEVAASREKNTRFSDIVGDAPSMRRVFRLIEEVADSNATVLISGESGTGKELVARALQRLSRRHAAPFVKVNCAVFSDTLLESELFGHVKGAFTDAATERRGRFELADGGTFLLDEIGDISPRLQVKLLRVLQEREFERVGGEESIHVDVRLIAATNRDLPSLVAQGAFREDLYYRLNVIPLHVPPLRQRRDDIPLLVEHFLGVFRERLGKEVTAVDQRALDVLMAHAWPGNVRQLENAIEHAMVRARGTTLTEDLLPMDVRFAGPSGASLPAASTEVEEITAALTRHHWHHEHAARELGISRTTLWRRMRKLGLQSPRR